MYRVTGGIDGVVYDLAVLDEAPWVQGTARIESHLSMAMGEWFRVTPVGPEYRLNLSDAASVLACLLCTTVISEVDGDVPDLGGGGCLDDPDAGPAGVALLASSGLSANPARFDSAPPCARARSGPACLGTLT